MNPDDKNLNNPPINDGNGNPPADNGNGDWTVPEGFDAEMFDENHALKQDAVKAHFDKLRAESDNYKKQSEDMRRKLSNKDALGSEEEYAKGYKNDDLGKFTEGEDEKSQFIKATYANVDKIAKDNGLNLAQANAVKDALFGLFKDLGVVDTRAPEEAASAQLELQKTILGDSAAEIVKDNTEWVKGNGLFSDSEKDMLVLAAEKGNPLINSVLHKFKALFGKSDSSDIPVNNAANNDGLPTDAVLAEEYKTASDARRQEIILSRIKAGRKGNLPIGAF